MRGGRRRRRRGAKPQAGGGPQDQDMGRRGREVNTKAWEHNSVSHPDVTNKGNFTSTKAHSSSSETLAASVNQSLGIEAGACVKVIATSRRTR